MKIVITSSGNSTDSKIDPRFSRCAYFAVYDTSNNVCEFIPNPNKDADDSAGPATVQLVSTFRASKIVSGEFGQKIKSLIDDLKIQMIVLKGPERKISDIIDMLNQ